MSIEQASTNCLCEQNHNWKIRKGRDSGQKDQTDIIKDKAFKVK